VIEVDALTCAQRPVEYHPPNPLGGQIGRQSTHKLPV
jgi:hypothetical protein